MVKELLDPLDPTETLFGPTALGEAIVHGTMGDTARAGP